MTVQSLKSKYFQHWQIISYLLVAYDIFAFFFSYAFCLWLRFDCRFSAVPEVYWNAYCRFIPGYALISVVIFWQEKLYNSIWRFASFVELKKTIIANVLTGAIHTIGITGVLHVMHADAAFRMPFTYYVFGIIVQFILTIGIRFSYRFVLLLRESKHSKDKENGKRVMIIGAGAAGQMIIRDILTSNKTTDRVVCIIDDNRNKHGRYVEGIPVVGDRNSILKAASDYHVDKIYLTMPSATALEKRDILNICKETGCELRNMPGAYQVYNGQVSVSSMKEVRVEDLLGRDPIKVDLQDIFHQMCDKTILITGGGGSIGSELARQIAAHQPKQLIILDIYENNAYDIQQELLKKYPEMNLVVLIGSVRDSRRMQQIFESYHPNIVFHAAAHKHVPLMEVSPCEAIKNNVVGTYKTAWFAAAYQCERFVLISTDKAVNPTNVMGASKRLCEMIIQSFNYMLHNGTCRSIPQLYTHRGEIEDGLKIPETSATEFVAVRFGNVLGSNGSVIPLFKKQIEQGGPVTVTHPDIIRYFMTIPEAVSLVLQAGVYAHGGEIFVLDMGEPVKIDDLARNLIKLSGYKPDVDIRINYIGLRPGEKLYEEKLMAEEGMKTTPNKLIHIGCPIAFDYDVFLSRLQELMNHAYDNDSEIREIIKQMVSTYHPES